MKFPRLLLNSGFSQDAFILSTFALSQEHKKQGKHTTLRTCIYKCHLEFSSVQNQSAFLILILIFVPHCRETQKYVYVGIWCTFGQRNNTFESLFRTNSIYGTGILSLLSRSSSKTVLCHSFFLARSSAVSEGWGYCFYCLSSNTALLDLQRGSRQFLCSG